MQSTNIYKQSSIYKLYFRHNKQSAKYNFWKLEKQAKYNPHLNKDNISSQNATRRDQTETRQTVNFQK